MCCCSVLQCVAVCCSVLGCITFIVSLDMMSSTYMKISSGNVVATFLMPPFIVGPHPFIVGFDATLLLLDQRLGLHILHLSVTICAEKKNCHWWYVLKKNKIKNFVPFYCGMGGLGCIFHLFFFDNMCWKKWKSIFVPIYCGTGGLGCIFLIYVFDNMCWTYMNIHEHTWTYMNIHEHTWTYMNIHEHTWTCH